MNTIKTLFMDVDFVVNFIFWCLFGAYAIIFAVKQGMTRNNFEKIAWKILTIIFCGGLIAETIIIIYLVYTN